MSLRAARVTRHDAARRSTTMQLFRAVVTPVFLLAAMLRADGEPLVDASSKHSGVEPWDGAGAGA